MLNLDQLRTFFRNAGITFYEAPDRTALLARFRGRHAHQVLTLLEVEGRFLQFRTVGWLTCRSGDKALPAVLQAMAEENSLRRMVKLGWDSASGEITAYADVWIEDGTLTDKQFNRMLQSYLAVIDLGYTRLEQAIASGRDPGAASVEDNLKEALKREGGSLPERVRSMLEKLLGKEDPEKKDPKQDDDYI